LCWNVHVLGVLLEAAALSVRGVLLWDNCAECFFFTAAAGTGKINRQVFHAGAGGDFSGGVAVGFVINQAAKLTNVLHKFLSPFPQNKKKVAYSAA
jgi:hypothetical protein